MTNAGLSRAAAVTMGSDPAPRLAGVSPGKSTKTTKRPPLPPGPPPQPCISRGDDDDVVWEDGFFLPAVGGAEYDFLGFASPLEGDVAGEAAYAYNSWFETKRARRLQRFEAKRKQLLRPGAWTTLPRKDLKYLIRKGVPHEYRGEVWWDILGCESRKVEAPDSYESLAQKKLDVKVMDQIECDLPRTFPDHKKFRTVAGMSQLRNVLRAFASHLPAIQYCQGLNFIAALLLIVFGSEERSFWAMVSAVEFLGVERYYTEGMTLLRADMRALSGALARRCPKVSKRLLSEDVDLTAVCSQWYMTWYALSLPAPTILRVWDVLFLEGFKVLFRIAVGVFKRAEADILHCRGFEEIMEQAKTWSRRQVEHNELLKASFLGMPPMRRRDLLRDRANALEAIEYEDEELRRRRDEAAAKRAVAAQAKANPISLASAAVFGEANGSPQAPVIASL